MSTPKLQGGRADLKALQGKIKRDPEGYKEEFLLQFRHYHALLEIFKLRPSKDSAEFANLVDFVSHVSPCYPMETAGYAAELMSLLDGHHAVLDATLRRALAQALILMRNRGQLAATTLLPLCFRLFRCHDKRLRSLMYAHIVSDIQNSNKKHRDEKLNRSLQAMLFAQLADDKEEASAKKSLAVLTELYRRNVWTDARTVNVIASACFHTSHGLLIAALKFFLGQDEKSEQGEDEDSDDDSKALAVATAGSRAVGKEDIYRAYNKGVNSSKKKKQAKLKRVIASAKRHAREENEGKQQATFAALQLLNDPQGFSEKLFQRIQGATTHRFETKVLILGVVSRVIATHKLQMLNFYPFVQKYLQPSQKDVTKLLSIATQACHELVPPDAVDPLLRQLVNQFVHDKARPEAVAVGLQTVREMCMRVPLVITEELLQDLTSYKKDRDRGVRMAARSLIGLFRELAPGMLVKKDRGKGADSSRTLLQFGHSETNRRVAGAELLGKKLEGETDSDDEGSDDEGGSDDEMGSEGQDEGEEGSGMDVGSDEDEDSSEEEEEEEEEEDDDDEEEEEELEPEPSAKKRKVVEGRKQQQQAEEGSLRQLKKAADAAKAAAKAAASISEGERKGAEDGEEVEAKTPVEYERFLTNEDFARIRALQAEATMEKALTKVGAKRARGVANEELEALKAKIRAGTYSEQRVNPDTLEGAHRKKRALKEERLARVMEGREGRDEFGASSARHKKKTGGKSNREKDKKKNLPLAARLKKSNKAKHMKAKCGKKNFKGKKGWKK